MASCSASLALPELSFSLSKPSSIRRIYVSKLSLCRPSWGGSCIRYQRLNLGGYRARIQAVKEENIVVEEKREDELVEDLKGLEFNGNGNGAATRRYDLNSSLNGYSNGSLVKYVNGNGVAVDAEVVGEFEEGELVDELKEKMKEDERKKKVEEIGKEEAWFKKSGLEKQIEVYIFFVVNCYIMLKLIMHCFCVLK